ncbi:hypothetical protein DQ353_04950 [Arthrobacter sp. AQ5-05]|uniref:restriction endonuclease subunit S n=1 Tax=Arthrobacter sp. AQ5-05 TaxID=2184581 RepID=UPI000DCB17A0|nr:restriction endonuclease subunit S [Arthrobacter sp. AQ5-05]RAX50307.1 hypothetical protein DQ353_04950 [Arthrobacter sp. AQ5-05]
MNNQKVQQVQLGEVCAVRSGFTSRTRLETAALDGTLTVQQGDINADGQYASETALRTMTPAASKQHYVDQGELVFRSRGPFWGACAITGIDEPVLAVAPLFILHPDPDVLDHGYLAWFLGRPLARHYFDSEAQGTGVKMVTKPALEALQISLPSLDIQHRIAAVAALSAEETRIRDRVASLRQAVVGHHLDRLALHSISALDSEEIR